jgi:hypothetical protein
MAFSGGAAFISELEVPIPAACADPFEEALEPIALGV